MSFVRYLQNLITVRGPLSMSQFMRECLVNPKYGYYTAKAADDIFGKKGQPTTEAHRAGHRAVLYSRFAPNKRCWYTAQRRRIRVQARL